MENKKEILGQYFTKIEVVNKLIELLLSYKKFDEDIKILEPSFGTGNFVSVLKAKGFKRIDGCEIDNSLTNDPRDFFKLSLKNKYDLIIGNPPFTKYNLVESYFKPVNYLNNKINSFEYLPQKDSLLDRIKIENAFLYKSIAHLAQDENSTIGFVLPVSFFIKNKNKKLKTGIANRFKTSIIYQNNETWFDYHIPCCFVILTNIENLLNKIILIYENGEKMIQEFDSFHINEELIPEVVKNKKDLSNDSQEGIPLNIFLENKSVLINKSYTHHNISAKNILEKTYIPNNKNVADYKLAVVRVGNSSVGKAGLINVKEDILNDMFFIFDLREKYKYDKEMKEKICKIINLNSDYFKKITSRVGSKSIKREDVLSFKLNLSL